ncbi:F-actin-capping protein subunit alpha [Pestalotiopsis sp. 9143b]|nr:F-actin-capping protein subunit alpha [Pestalotiopsis sp. 9143b]
MTAGAGDVWTSTAREHLADALKVAHGVNTSANLTENDEAGQSVASDLQDFDVFLDSTVKRYVDLSQDIGGPVAKQAQCVLFGLREERKIIESMSRMSKPDSAALDSLFGPVAQAMAVAKATQDANRGHALYNHLSCVADGIMLLGWMKVQMRPFRHIDQMLECAQYFGNKVKMDHKQKSVSSLWTLT